MAHSPVDVCQLKYWKNTPHTFVIIETNNINSVYFLTVTSVSWGDEVISSDDVIGGAEDHG
jgi:hypothetical protein